MGKVISLEERKGAVDSETKFYRAEESDRMVFIGPDGVAVLTHPSAKVGVLFEPSLASVVGTAMIEAAALWMHEDWGEERDNDDDQDANSVPDQGLGEDTTDRPV